MKLVFDIGGTHLRVALADGGELRKVKKLLTPAEPAQGIEAVRAFLVAEGAQVSEAVGAIAGIVKRGVVERTRYLPKWDGFNLAVALEDVCRIPATRLLNDAEAAGIGEALAGAGKGVRVVAYITVGTGIGGALIIDGAPVPHAVGHEPGKQILDYGQMRTFEDFAGGASLTEEFGAPPERLARALVEGRVRVLATGLYNTLRLWSPDILILGGSLINDATGYPLANIKHELAALPVVLPPLPPIVRSALGDTAGLTGAALAPMD
ncbi:MAG: ROK family protein [bacterium]|nr:ROK family protein [bacterium]